MIDRQNANRLLRKLEASSVWPTQNEAKLLKQLLDFIHLREADGEHLKASHPGGWDDDKVYLVDPLAARICEAFADLQFGEEPEFSAKAKGNQQRLDDLVEDMSLPSELQQAAETQVSEGEVWWRGRVDKDARDYPFVEFHSRTKVVPMFFGARLAACAFIDVIEEGNDAWRYVELHAEGIVLQKLYKVKTDAAGVLTGAFARLPIHWQAGKSFGDPVPLTSRPETADLDPVWEHDLPILAGRILNKRGRGGNGVSQFARAKDLFYSLNEATTIGQQNMRLTARKRAVIDESVLQHDELGPDGRPLNPVFNSQEEVLVASSMDENLDSKQGPFKILEYSFDAQGMIAWDDHLTDKILVRTRTAPSLVGRNTSGAQTAPAIRARLLDSQLAAEGKARFFDDEVPTMLTTMQMLDAAPTENGGFDREWSDPTEAPSMKRKSIIPEEMKDKMDRHAVAVGAELESTYTAIADLHPEWGDTEIKEEQKRIREERKEFGSDIGSPNGTINREDEPDELPPPPPGGGGQIG